jgi:hypothetical protein
MASQAGSDTQQLPEFKDFDDETVFQEVQREAANEHAKNFVVEFSAKKAFVALNADAEQLGNYLDRPVQVPTDPKDTFKVRWM